MKSLILSISAFAFLHSLNAQEACSCDKVFAQVVQKVESNYLGLKHMEVEGGVCLDLIQPNLNKP